MKSVRARLEVLERVKSPFEAQCFWCDCEGLEASPNCEHRQWAPIGHEEALALLDQPQPDNQEESNAVS
jgi:hypothetical protein